MASVKKGPDFRNIDAPFAQTLQRIFYYENVEEDKSVRNFTDWYRKNGYGELKDRMVYDVLGGRAKPSVTMIKAFLAYTNDVELHGLFETDEALKAGTAASLRAAADMLHATADRLEGTGK